MRVAVRDFADRRSSMLEQDTTAIRSQGSQKARAAGLYLEQPTSWRGMAAKAHETTSALFLVLFVETLEELGKAVRDAFVDDVGVHGAKLLADFMLDICPEAALLLPGFFSLHRSVIRRLSWPVVHVVVPPVPDGARRGGIAAIPAAPTIKLGFGSIMTVEKLDMMQR
jgi:hypothetical protein